MRMPGLSTSSFDLIGDDFEHHVGAFDLDVGCGELDLGGAGGLMGEKADVGVAGLDQIERLLGARPADEIDRDAGAAGELVGEVDGHAARGLGRALRQDAVAEVDRGTQAAGGGEVFQDVGGHGRSLVAVVSFK